MSDLAATNCQTSCNNEGCGWGGNNSCIWILILLFFCGNGSSIFSRNDDCGCGCESIIWILILLSLCGNNSCGFNLGCGCGC